MKRTLLTLLTLLGLAGVHGQALACPDAPQPPLPRSELRVETRDGGNHVFDVELAREPDEKACGLMMRQRLGRDEGMLFEYRPPGPAFMWMRNTILPLDMVFIDAEGRIVHLEENAEPLTTTSRGTRADVAGVLEVLAGTVERLGIRRGDRVIHPIFD